MALSPVTHSPRDLNFFKTNFPILHHTAAEQYHIKTAPLDLIKLHITINSVNAIKYHKVQLLLTGRRLPFSITLTPWVEAAIS